MTDQPFRVSKDSIEIPYRRFLADSSAGFLLILLLGAAYYFPLFTKTALRQTYGPAGVGPEVKLFFFIVIFLLATPMGFAVNAVSWLVLTQPIDVVERLAGQHAQSDGRVFAVSDIAASRHIHSLGARFGINDAHFAEQTSFLRQALESPALARFAPEMQARGLLILLRNTALFSFAMAFLSLAVANPQWWRTSLLVISAALTAIALVLPWHTRGRTCVTLALLALLMLIVAGATAYANRFALQGLIMMVVSVAFAVLAGIIGFYNSCAVVLYAYFAEVAIGDEEELDENAPISLKKITAMIRAARQANAQKDSSAA